MLEEVDLFDQEIKFTLGFAGSGKSTELAKLVTDEDVVVTPTHKAASVLMSKGIKNVVTIHSLLKLVPTINENYNPLKKQRLQRLKQMAGVDVAHIKTIYIDEFSLVSTKIFDLLLEMLPATAIVHLFGDPYQLSTIDGDAIVPEDYSSDIKRLTTQHRAEAPEVVETFMRFVAFLDGSGEMNLVLNKGIKSGTLEDFNPETDRALAFTNAKVQELNSEIATILGISKDFITGTELLANQMECKYAESTKGALNLYPACMSKGKLMDGDKLIDTINKISNEIDKFGTARFFADYESGYIEIEDEVFEVIYDTTHYATQKKIKEEIDKWQTYLYQNNKIPEDVTLKEWCRNNKGARGVRERGQAWSHYLAHSNLVFSLHRPYASTCHKSQGSEFSTVFIAQEDIKKSIFRGHYETYARLMYVSLSRAINRVVIIK